MSERIGIAPSLEGIVKDPRSFSYIKRVAPDTEKTIEELIEGNQKNPTNPHFELWLRYLATYSRLMEECRVVLEEFDPKDRLTVHEESIRSWVGDFVIPDIGRTNTEFTEVDRISLDALRAGNNDLDFLLNVPQNT